VEAEETEEIRWTSIYFICDCG